MSVARRDMRHLYEVEYGVRRELVLRLVGVCLSAFLMHLYNGMYMPFVWCLGYLLCHMAHFLFIVAHLDRADTEDLTIAGLLYLVVVLSFMWLPAWLGMQSDPTLIWVGSVLMISAITYQIRRADRMLWLIWAQISIFGALSAVVMASHVHRFEGLVGQLGAVLVTAAAFAYVALAMLYTRKSRLTMEDAAEQMAQDQKMSAIGRLAGGMAHDFNNMLTVMKGNLDLYHLSDAEEDREAAVREAQIAVLRAEEVVQQLMIYARKAPVRLRVLDANLAMDQMMMLVRSMVPSRIRRNFVPLERRLHIEVDEGQLTTALLNLVKNAVDAMEGQGTMTIATGHEVLEGTPEHHGARLEPGAYVTITVSDTGAGIVAEHLDHVMEPFFTTKPEGKGTGLGLSMVAGFVQGAGGGLRIRSSAQGTDVTLLLPAARAPHNSGGPQSKSVSAASPDGPMPVRMVPET
ncbi:sensor histidine kinase [Sagittula salina]|uniref:histidine kinase n=1 Tax=Sagittula salina TaxID=2820268 RepID=A0A940MP92_9RHOB|nr:ATP-binding protein [Sagittula salina]MBP0482392.1 hypothetical protein [Sagittula salina]